MMGLGYSMPQGDASLVAYFLSRGGVATGRGPVRDVPGGPDRGDGDSREAGGVNLLWALFLAFAGLKWAGFVSWSWWWVACPVLIPLAIPLVWISLYLALTPIDAAIRALGRCR